MIRIIGPRNRRDPNAINTTSRSPTEWTSQLSPFNLGPVRLYGEHTARVFENGWQFAKVYPEYADAAGNPTATYWHWARRGWNASRAYRYPVGKGRRPLYSLWQGKKLGYIEARHQIYLPLYRNLVAKTHGYALLKKLYAERGQITLFDFDGYDHHRLGLTLHDVLNNPHRICGHAFILAMMLTYGENFTPEDLTVV